MRLRLPNLTNALLFAGVVTLTAFLFVPEWSAERTAKVETRAEEAARALLAAALEQPDLVFASSPEAERLTDRFRALCAESGHPESYLPDPHPKPDSLSNEACLLFGSKHFCFMLTRRPPPTTGAPESRPSRDPFEVYAWPRTLNPPGHTAFFVPEDGASAFTRNLLHQYVGWDEDRRKGRIMPRGGEGVPRRGVEGRYYRGRDDERWILLH